MIKNILKKTYKISTLFIESVISILSVIFFSKFSSRFKLSEKATNRCIILGNGYSLKKNLENDLELFKNEDIFSVNLFCHYPIFKIIKPGRHIIADSGFWNHTVDMRIADIQEKFYQSMNSIDWQMNLYIPFEGYKFIKQFKKIDNPNINIIPFNMTPVSGFNNISFLFYKLSLGMPKPTNVLNAAIFLSLNLGYKNINIYGADHSWMKDLFINENNEVCCSQNHFYDNKSEIITMEEDTLADGLRSIVEAFDSYRLLKAYSIYKSAQIINCTEGSYLDVFDRLQK